MFPAQDTIDTYGGELAELHPVTDPTTDQSAEGMNDLKGSVAGLTHTGLHAWARFTTHATTPVVAASGARHDAAWGNDIAVVPTVARTGTGVFTVTWPATVTNQRGDTQSVNFRAAVAPNVEGATAYHAQAERTAANVLTVRVFDMSGVATDAAGTTLWVGAL